MKNPKVYNALSILGFVISAIFTVIMFCSNSPGLLLTGTMFGAAILWEFGKYALLYQGIYGPFGVTIKSILIAGWVFVTVGSIIASTSQVLNDANENKNINLENSAAYQQQQDALSNKKDLYAQKKKEIEDLKTLQGKQQDEGNNIVNAMPRDYIDRKNQQRAATQALISKTQEQINSKSNELTNISKEIAAPPAEIKAELLETTGAMAMFKLIADKLNKNPKNKKNPYSADEIGIFFYMLLGLGIEFLANIFAFLSQYYANIKEKEIPLETTNSNNSTNTNSKIVTIPHSNNSSGITASALVERRPQSPVIYGQTELQNNYVPEVIPQKTIGFVAPAPTPKLSNNIKNGELDAYLKCMYEKSRKTELGLEAPGYEKIHTITKINLKTCRYIHTLLCTKEIIKTMPEFKRTIILKSRDEI